MKKTLYFSVALFLSIVLGLIAPHAFDDDKVSIDNANNVSVLDQKVIGYSNTNNINYKIYADGKLIGIVNDKNKIEQDIKNFDFGNENNYRKDQIGLTENVYIVEEYSKMIFEDINEKILEYLANNKCIGIRTTCVKFSTSDGVYDKIYIANEEDFMNARDKFILNFISQDVLNKLNSGEKIESPLSYGSIETGISVKQKMEITTGVAYPDEIFDSEKEIYEYLCYGRNTERQYYTTLEGDTLAGVGYHFNNMSSKQIMMLNSDIIKSENQILEAGTVLNVTYYTSPLTITVTKERLAQEVIFPEPVEYEEDKTKSIGYTEIVQEEENGLQNVLYSEKWINGVRQESLTQKLGDPYVIKAAVRGRVIIGAETIIPSGLAGTGNWRWPVQNPAITCDYYCYAGHGGVDFYNLYKPWDYALAIDSGVVIDTGWTNIGGYYARVDHNNGYITYYGHFSSPAYVEAGQSVSAGEVLGPIGMTGNATGPHVHLAMYENGVLINPCSVLNCSILY